MSLSDDPEGDAVRQELSALAAAMREPIDRTNIWAWAARQKKAMAEYQRKYDWLVESGPLGLGAICAKGNRVRTIPVGGLNRVVGCGDNQRCDCHARWDAHQAALYNIERDARVPPLLIALFGNAEPDAVIAAICNMGYPERAAEQHVRKQLPD